MNLDELSPELKEKALACKTPEEMLALAKAEGYELSDAELAGVAGGDFWDTDCPPLGNCGTVCKSDYC